MFDIAAFKTTDPVADLTIRQMNEATDFIASEVATIHTVPKAHYKWYQYDRSNLRRVVTKKSSKAAADKIEFNAFTSTGKALLHKLAADVDPQDERDADAPVADLEVTAAMQIAEHLLIDYEAELVTLVTTSGNYPSGLTVSLTTGTNAFSDTGGDPVTVFKDAKLAVRAQCQKVPNTAAMAYEVVEALRIHPQLIERIKYTGTVLPDNLMLNILGVDSLLVGKGMYNSAVEGQTDSLASIWGKHAILFYKNAAKGLKVMTFARTFAVQEMYSRRYNDDERGAAKPIQVIESGWEYDLKLVARATTSGSTAAAGYLIQNAIV